MWRLGKRSELSCHFRLWIWGGHRLVSRQCQKGRAGQARQGMEARQIYSQLEWEKASSISKQTTVVEIRWNCYPFSLSQKE